MGFLDDILERFGLGRKLRGWIRGCLYSSMSSVLLNGSSADDVSFINPSSEAVSIFKFFRPSVDSKFNLLPDQTVGDVSILPLQNALRDGQHIVRLSIVPVENTPKLLSLPPAKLSRFKIRLW
ncbi:hypothetical protein LXL04_004254 [Taraxacum kok-saghyz]